MSTDRQRLHALLRTNLYFFVQRCFGTLSPDERFIPTWHVEAMCWQLQAVAEGRTPRLLITVPPRHLKSICASVALCAWVLGRQPSHKILVASYGQDLAAKHARDFRSIIEAPWYQDLFPQMRINPRRNTEAEILTTRSGGRKAVSLGGSVTGFGADMLIIDDLMKAADARLESGRQGVKDFYEQTLFSRLNNKQTGSIVAIQQRLHEDDFPAYLIDKGNFEHLNLKAIAEENECFKVNLNRTHFRHKGDALFPAQEPLDVLERIRQEIGSSAFSAQYQQNPVPPEGNRIRWNWFGTYDERPPRYKMQLVVQSWDTAATAEPTSDFSVCQNWGFREGKWYLLDLYRARLEYPSLIRRVLQLRSEWNADQVIVEHANTGIPLVSEMRMDHGIRLLAYSPRVDKETRLAAQTAKIETGDYLLPTNADWLPAFKNELLVFPHGRFDDQVDATSQFLDWIGTRRGRSWCHRQLNGGERYRPPGRRRR